jgi:hypothetical protein
MRPSMKAMLEAYLSDSFDIGVLDLCHHGISWNLACKQAKLTKPILGILARLEKFIFELLPTLT